MAASNSIINCDWQTWSFHLIIPFKSYGSKPLVLESPLYSMNMSHIHMHANPIDGSHRIFTLLTQSSQQNSKRSFVLLRSFTDWRHRRQHTVRFIRVNVLFSNTFAWLKGVTAVFWFSLLKWTKIKSIFIKSRWRDRV